MQYAQAGSRGRDAVLTPRDWQQSAARVSTRSIASAVAVMAQQAQQQRPCPAPSAPPERSAGVRDAIPVGVINCALVASLCGPQMALLALRCRCSRGAARRARAAVLSQYAIATHSLWEGVHTFTGSRRDPCWCAMLFGVPRGGSCDASAAGCARGQRSILRSSHTSGPVTPGGEGRV